MLPAPRTGSREVGGGEDGGSRKSGGGRGSRGSGRGSSGSGGGGGGPTITGFEGCLPIFDADAGSGGLYAYKPMTCMVGR